MAATDFKTVSEYIRSRPRPVQAALRQVRTAIRGALPDADEVISYQIAAYRYREGMIVFFAGWKAHYSLYPATPGVVTAFKKQLAGYELSKGTIRFPLEKPVPVKLIARIAKFRAKEVRARA